MPRFAVILPAAGRSTRFGHPTEKKTYAELDRRAVWLRAADAFLNRDDVARVIVAIAAEDRELFERRYRPEVAFRDISVIEGGAERSDSIAQALAQVPAECDFVAIHDAARPCIPADLVDRVFAAAVAHGAALPAVAVADTLKRADNDRRVIETVPRVGLFAAQTPQVFRRDWIEQAYADRHRLVVTITDDSQLVEALGHPCVLVDGSPENLKITTAADLRLASAILAARPTPERDKPIHPFANDGGMWAN